VVDLERPALENYSRAVEVLRLVVLMLLDVELPLIEAVSQAKPTQARRRDLFGTFIFACPLTVLLFATFCFFTGVPGIFQGSKSRLTGGDLRSLEALDELASYNKRWLSPGVVGAEMMS
jgi:hypothetical protein